MTGAESAPTSGPVSRHRSFPALALAAVLLAPGVRAHGPIHEQILQLTSELAEHPDDPERLAHRGDLYLRHGLSGEALADFERLAVLQPGDITNAFRLGAAALELGRTNEATRHLERFVQARPGSAAGQRLLGRALWAAGRPRDAAGCFGVAITLDADAPPDAYLEQARALMAASADTPEVLVCLDAGMERHGPLPALQLLAVDLEMSRGATDLALQRLDALTARAERKERWLARRGDLLLQAGRCAEAREAFLVARRALDALPDKQRRAWTATELRQQLETRLTELSEAPEAGHSQPR